MTDFEKPGWFRVTLPEGWEVDESESPLAIHHPDGVGALQVTVEPARGLPEGARLDVGLLLGAFLERTDTGGAEVKTSSAEGMEWATCEHAGQSDEGERLFWRLAMVANHELVAFLTYACPEEHKDVERAAVDSLLSTFRFV